MRLATGYDDAYNVTPARLLRNALHLGYRKVINHYVGMSHYFRLRSNRSGALYFTLNGGVLNSPCDAWHRDFAARAGNLGYALIFSISYEILNEFCTPSQRQRSENGEVALTGWVPPSTRYLKCLRLKRCRAAALRDRSHPRS